MTDLELGWNFSNWPMGDAASVISGRVTSLATEYFPDVADLFPFHLSCDAAGHFADTWWAIRMSEPVGADIRSAGQLKGQELEMLQGKILPFTPRSHRDLFQLLGEDWFSPRKFTYVGPYRPTAACWPDVDRHIVDWLNHLVVPDVLRRNKQRVLRAIPLPPQFNLAPITASLWVHECETTLIQGTAFALDGIGFVTCHHTLGPTTRAFQPHVSATSYPIRIKSQNADLDLAIFEIDAPAPGHLSLGSADDLRQLDHVAVAGFPNFSLGDSGVIMPGLVVGFRTVSGIRRILTNAPIVAGMSGGPVLDRENMVIGVAVTGADRMERVQDTEDHGIVPIDALRYLG